MQLFILVASTLRSGAQLLVEKWEPENYARQVANFEGAANRRMTVPVDISRQGDTASAELRQARDQSSDKYYGAAGSLFQAGVQAPIFSDGSTVGPQPEFPVLPGEVWVIGKFESYHTFVSSSERSVYTEINFRVQHVFGKHSERLAPGSMIDIAVRGGTVLTKEVGVLLYAVLPEKYDLQPGGTYLVQLIYTEGVDYFIQTKFWDLSSGRVEPGDAIERARAEGKHSQINGMELPALIEFLKKNYTSAD